MQHGANPQRLAHANLRVNPLTRVDRLQNCFFVRNNDEND